jgi:hypothetical protein
MWDPRRLTTLYASTACYRSSCYFVWVWNFVFDVTRRAQIESLKTKCWGGDLDQRGKKEQRKLHNEEIRNLCIAQIIIRMTNWGRMRVARVEIGQIRINTRIWSEGLKAKDHSEDNDLDGNMLLKQNLQKHDRNMRTAFFWLRIRTCFVCCGHSNLLTCRSY